MEKSYRQGMIDGIQLWGNACSRQGICSKCPISVLAGAGVACQEFAKQFPAKTLTILQEVADQPLSYYEEFCLRFPNANVNVQTLALLACRKAVFEGYISCNGKDDGLDCVECWSETYEGDITEEV